MSIAKVLLTAMLIIVFQIGTAQNAEGLRSVENKNSLLIKNANHYQGLAESNEKEFEYYYLAACYWALAKDTRKAFYCLNRAVEYGFVNEHWLLNEDDFKSLHRKSEWRSLINKVRLNKEFSESHTQNKFNQWEK